MNFRPNARAPTMLGVLLVTGALHVGVAQHQPSFLPQPGALTLRDDFNGGVTMRDKAGGLIARAELNAFFNSVRPNARERLIDPSIYYDTVNGRFFIAAAGAVRDDPRCAVGNCVAHDFVAVSKGRQGLIWRLSSVPTFWSESSVSY